MESINWYGYGIEFPTKGAANGYITSANNVINTPQFESYLAGQPLYSEPIPLTNGNWMVKGSSQADVRQFLDEEIFPTKVFVLQTWQVKTNDI